MRLKLKRNCRAAYPIQKPVVLGDFYSNVLVSQFLSHRCETRPRTLGNRDIQNGGRWRTAGCKSIDQYYVMWHTPDFRPRYTFLLTKYGCRKDAIFDREAPEDEVVREMLNKIDVYCRELIVTPVVHCNNTSRFRAGTSFLRIRLIFIFRRPYCLWTWNRLHIGWTVVICAKH